jgi:hypothetical protein
MDARGHSIAFATASWKKPTGAEPTEQRRNPLRFIGERTEAMATRQSRR